MSSAISTPTRMPVAWLEGLLGAMGAVRHGRKWQCPSHGLAGEHSVSLALRTGDNGCIVLFCHGGCDWRDILRALHLPADALRMVPTVGPAEYAHAFLRGVAFPPPRTDHGDGGAGWIAVSIDEHPYGDPTAWAWKLRERNAAGVKRMYWQSLNPKGERVPGLLGRSESAMPLYRIREVRMAVAMEETVVLVESESSVDALGKAGVYATTWAGGAASAPLARLRSDLSAAAVLLVPDHDEAGLACAEQIIRALPDARVQLGDPGQDARDVLAIAGAGWFR